MEECALEVLANIEMNIARIEALLADDLSREEFIAKYSAIISDDTPIIPGSGYDLLQVKPATCYKVEIAKKKLTDLVINVGNVVPELIMSFRKR